MFFISSTTEVIQTCLYSTGGQPASDGLEPSSSQQFPSSQVSFHNNDESNVIATEWYLEDITDI